MSAPSLTAVHHYWFSFLLLLVLVLLLYVDAQKFEPYQLNGGLVSAVAGKNFCVVACDTRMIDGGYEIYSRRHIQSRLWAVANDNDGTSNSFQEQDADDDCNDQTKIYHSDGSVKVPNYNTDKRQRLLSDIPKIKLQHGQQQQQQQSSPPTLVASAGCNADCEGLKRIVRADARAAEYFKRRSLSVEQVANLLSQILYRRRGFPFYSFCVVGGLTSEGQGAAYVYDALGSYERVAVGTAGTGRELLQPILDRRFRTWQPKTVSAATVEEQQVDGLLATKQRRRPFIVGNQVDCDVDEAVSILIHAYRSVSEREIGVGDLIVLCVTEQDDDGSTTCRVLAVPMKEH